MIMCKKKWMLYSLACFMLIACMFSVSKSAAAVQVKKVTVKSSQGRTVTLLAGKKAKLKVIVSVKPNKVSNKKVTFKSSNVKIAKVTKRVLLKG